MERWQAWTLAALTVVFMSVLAAGEEHARRLASADAAAAIRYAQTHPEAAGLNGTTGGTPENESAQTPSDASSGPMNASTTTVASLNNPAPGSVASWLASRASAEGRVRIVLLGSSSIAGQGATPGHGWADLFLKDLDSAHILASAMRLGMVAAGSGVINGEVTAAIRAKPDLVVIETGAAADWAQNVPVTTSLANLDYIASRLSQALPDARIVWLPTPPIANETAVNGSGLTYKAYLDAEARHARSQGWTYLDLHAAVLAQLQAQGLTVNAILADAYHLNDDGMAMWAKTFETAISEGASG
ncbi:MAG: SGNH/GDSL hydrolase family protein [Thermoflavifilum sp.]|nr:SGNH/GDSL hydrolase family protein [Thermoflavifilum sp.]MCL6513803.1 SGNH/GDSL hydrolase family protein [Alicyclobacillus sp.]